MGKNLFNKLYIKPVRLFIFYNFFTLVYFLEFNNDNHTYPASIEKV